MIKVEDHDRQSGVVRNKTGFVEDQTADCNKLGSMLKHLESLSGRFGELERRTDGTLFTNDEQYTEIIPQIESTSPSEAERLGVFIGSGGVLSLLPNLPIDAAVVIDKNSAVPETVKTIADLIREQESPEAVLQKLNDPEFIESHEVLKVRWTQLSRQNFDKVKTHSF